MSPAPDRAEGGHELKAALIERIDERRDQLVRLASDLIGFDTTARTKPEEEAREEASLQRYLVERLAAVGVDSELIEPDAAPLMDERQVPAGTHFRGRPQLVARLDGRGRGRTLLLNGHIDVVPVSAPESWRSDPLQAHEEDGKLYGRGACDMKGGVASMVFAVEQLASMGVALEGSVVVNTVTDEESSGAGSVACARLGVRGDACIVPEPTELQIWLACRGTCLCMIEVDGRASHVEIPTYWGAGGGVNAIDKARFILDGLDRLSAEWAIRPSHRHPYLSPGHIRPVRIEAGDWPVTTPSRCLIDCDVTFLPVQADRDGWEGDVCAEVERWIAAVAAADPWLAANPPRVTWAMVTPPAEIAADDPIVVTAAAQLTQLGRVPILAGLDSWYDGATFARLHRSAALALGPGSINIAHGRDEYVPIDELVDCCKTIGLVILDYCGIAGERPSEGSP